MDRTRDFRDMVNDLRRIDGTPTRSSDVMRPSVTMGGFTKAANEMMTSIDGMQRHIITAQSEYLNLNRHLTSSSSGMSDDDRNRLEADVDQFGHGITQQIEILKANVSKKPTSEAQLQTHEHTIIICLLTRLARVTNSMQLLNRQRSQQIRDEIERLHPAAFQPAPALVHAPSFITVTPTATTTSSTLIDPLVGESRVVDDRPELRFTEAEQQLYEQENAQLLDGLEDHLDQVRKSEERIHEIGRLVSMFQDKVEEQEHTIQTILEHAVKSKLDITKGNNELRKPTERSSVFRGFVLAILVGASFSLLFLDWVTP